MRAFVVERDWLTVCQLPAYAPDLDPVEGTWSLPRRGPPATGSAGGVRGRIVWDPG